MRKIMLATLGVVFLLGGCAQERADSKPAVSPEQRALYSGIQAYHDGKLDVAEEQYRKVLARNPDEPYANLNLGLVLARTDRTDDAKLHYRRAIENGEGVEVREIYWIGGKEDASTTVADVARSNLKLIDG